MPSGICNSSTARWMFDVATSSGTPGSRLNDTVVDGNDCEGKTESGDGPRGEDMFEAGRIVLEFRIDLQHHHVLIALGIDDRDLPLRKRVVQRIVDILDPNAETRSLLPVDLECQLQPAGITVARNVGNAFDRFHAFADDRR